MWPLPKTGSVAPKTELDKLTREQKAETARNARWWRSQQSKWRVVNRLVWISGIKDGINTWGKPHAKRRIKKRGKANCHRFERWRQRRHSERGGSELKPNCWKDTKRNPAQRKYSLWKELPRPCWCRECIAWHRMRKQSDQMRHMHQWRMRSAREARQILAKYYEGRYANAYDPCYPPN